MWVVVKPNKTETRSKTQTFAPKHPYRNVNMSSTPTYDTVDYTQFVYKEPRRNPSGGFNSYLDVSPNEKKSPTFQLPQCIAKFGVNDPIGESTRRNLEVSVSDAGVQQFFDNLDKQNIKVAAEKSKTFFKKELTEEILAMTLHRKTLKYDEEKKYDPLLRLKCTPSGKNKTKVYIVGTDSNGDEEYSEGTLDQITPWSKIVPIVSVSGLWFTSTQFGQTLLAKALMVWPAESKDEVSFTGLNIKKRKLNPVGETEASAEAASTPVVEQEKSPFSDEIM